MKKWIPIVGFFFVDIEKLIPLYEYGKSYMLPILLYYHFIMLIVIALIIGHK